MDTAADQAQVEAGWFPGLNDNRAVMEAVHDPAFLAMASHVLASQGVGVEGNQGFQSPASPFNIAMPGGGPGGIAGQGMAPNQLMHGENIPSEVKQAFSEPSNSSDAQLNLKRRISQLVQMRAMQQNALFGPTGGAQTAPLFRAQSLPQLQRDDNPRTTPKGDVKEEIALWKSQSHKDLQYGPGSPRAGMMMPASPSPMPLSRPQSTASSMSSQGNDGLHSPLNFIGQDSPQPSPQQMIQQQQQQQYHQHSQQTHTQQLQQLNQQHQQHHLQQQSQLHQHQIHIQQQQQQQQLFQKHHQHQYTQHANQQEYLTDTQQPAPQKLHASQQLPGPSPIQQLPQQQKQHGGQNNPQQNMSHHQQQNTIYHQTPSQSPQTNNHQTGHFINPQKSVHDLNQIVSNNGQHKIEGHHMQNMLQNSHMGVQNNQQRSIKQQNTISALHQNQTNPLQNKLYSQSPCLTSNQHQPQSVQLTPEMSHKNVHQHTKAFPQQDNKIQLNQLHKSDLPQQHQQSHHNTPQQFHKHQQQIQQQYNHHSHQQMLQKQPHIDLVNPFRKPSTEMAPSWINTSQGNLDKMHNTSLPFPSIGNCVTTMSTTSTVMSAINGALTSTMSVKPDTSSTQYSVTQKTPHSTNIAPIENGIPQSLSNAGNNTGHSLGSKLKNGDVETVSQCHAEKPKKKKQRTKDEKPSSKISDLMASDIDRKLLAMFPQYQFYLDQNTKPSEELMPAPAIKKPKKKRVANVTIEGEGIKRKKVKKKPEASLQGITPHAHPGFTPSPLLASEAAPMDTDLNRRQLEDKQVAQILAAIKDPKAEVPVSGSYERASTEVPSATNVNNSKTNIYDSADQLKPLQRDPFDFDDDLNSSSQHPLYSKKTGFTESGIKDSCDKQIHSGETESEVRHNKYCCNHCESVGEVQSIHCQNKLHQKSVVLPEPPQKPVSDGYQVQVSSTTTTTTYQCSTSLSSPSVQVSSADSIIVSSHKAEAMITEDQKPVEFSNDKGAQVLDNHLANLQASLTSMFNSSLSQENTEKIPRPQIPPELLAEYLDRTEGNIKSRVECPQPNGILPGKTAEVLSTNYSPPHDIKPVPPSLTSPLNKSESKTDAFSPGFVSDIDHTEGTPQTTPTQDKGKIHINMDDEEMLADVLPLKPGSAEEELFERLKNNRQEPVPHCDCLGPNAIVNESVEGPYYTQLGSARDIPSIRKLMEERTGVMGKALRIEKIIYSGKEGKSTQGCPIAKWIIRRSGPEEKYLCVCRHRPGHFCVNAYIVTNLVAWEGVPADIADSLYSYLRTTVTKHGFETERRCGTNETKTCACQGIDLVKRGASFSFGCSWSMYFNGCKYARSRDAKKFKLKDVSKEGELEEQLQDLATKVGPLYEMMAPDAHRNQCNFEVEGNECRLGINKARPFSGVTACVDFCAHAHKDLHNMNNGSTVVVTLTKHRGFEKPDDEQLHVLPLYILDHTDEHGNIEGQRDKIKNGSLEVLANFPLEARIRSQPLTPKKRAKGGKKESPQAKKRKLEEQAAGHMQPPHNHSLPKSAAASPEKEQKAVLENLMKHENSESLSFEDLMSHANMPGFQEIYGKFWDYFYANGTFPPGTFLSRWAANKMNLMKNQSAHGAGNHIKNENNIHLQHHQQSQGQHLPQGPVFHQGHGQQNGHHHPGMRPEVTNHLNNQPQVQQYTGGNVRQTPLDLLTEAAMVQNVPGGHNAFSSLPVPFQPDVHRSSQPSDQTQDIHRLSQQQAMQHAASSLPPPHQHSNTDGQGIHNRADMAGNLMCNGVNKLHGQDTAEPNEQILDPTVVKCEWQYNEEVFNDSSIGGVAIALSHGAVLFEVAKRELHATTALKNPNRYQPTRISLVFYQHKNLNYRHHGWYKNERKMEMLRQKKLEKMKAEVDNESPIQPANMANGEVKQTKKKKKKDVIDFSKTSAAQYKYMWDAPVRHGLSLTTDSIITRWIDPQPMVSGPYQRWV